MEKRECNYRKCGKDITKMRPNAKYCSRNCKSCERKYNKLEENRVEEEKERIVKMLIDVKNIDDEVVALFNLINNKK